MIGGSRRRREEKSNKRARRQTGDLGKGEGGGGRAGTDIQTLTRTHTPPAQRSKCLQLKVALAQCIETREGDERISINRFKRKESD